MRFKSQVVLILLAACLASLSAQSVRTVPLDSAGMAYSPSRGLLYVAVLGSSPQRPLTVTQVNPATGAMGASLPLEAEPRAAVMSRDERYLYVGLANGTIVRVDLVGFRPDLVVSTAATGVDEPEIVEIRPLPGRSTSFVASVAPRGRAPENAVLAVFDGAVMRPLLLPAGLGIFRVTFGADSSVLWGYDGFDHAFSFYPLRVDQQGISVAGEPGVALFGGGINQLEFGGGSLFASNGRVIDPEARVVLGRYNGFATRLSRSFAIDWDRERVYFASREDFDFFLAEFDLRTFRRLGDFRSTSGQAKVPWVPEQTVLCGSTLAFGGYGSDQPFITLFPLALIEPSPPWKGPPDQPLDGEVRRLPLPNNTITYDSTRNRILASTPFPSSIGNSVVPIDPVRGRIGDAAFVGADPWQMAVSDDGAYLYVGLYSGWAVQRVRLDSLEPDLRVPLWSDDELLGRHPTRATEILPVAGRPESFVVARADVPRSVDEIASQGVVVYDGEIPRAKATTGRPAEEAIWSIQWDEQRVSLYAFPNFGKLSVSAEGVEVEAVTEGVTKTIFSTDQLRCQYDICFTPTADVIDAKSQESLGRLAVPVWEDDFYWPEFIVPDLDRGLVYLLADLGVRNYGDRRLTVDAYDVRTFGHVGRLVIDDAEPPTGFLVWGGDQLAVSTFDEVILFPMSKLHQRSPGQHPTVEQLRPPERWVFPFVEEDYRSFTGFAVSNPSSQARSFRVTPFTGDGDPNQLVGGRQELDLEPHTQLARLGSEIFSGYTSLGNMWWALDGPADSPGGFFLFGHGDGLDGAIAQRGSSRVLYFPRVTTGENGFRGRTAINRLYLINPNGYSVRVRLTIGGKPRPPAIIPESFDLHVTLPPFGFSMQDVRFWLGYVDYESAYVKAEVDQERGGLVGFQMIGLDDPETQIAINAVPADQSGVLYSAQLASGPEIFSNLKLVNTSDQPRRVVLKAVGDDGSLLAGPVDFTLGAGESLEEDADVLFSFPIADTVAGSLRVEADGPGLVGNLLVGDPQTLDFASAVNLDGETFEDAVFSHVANVADFFTGLALYNPSVGAAEVALEVFTADGQMSGGTSFFLPAGARLSRLLPQLVPASTGQAGGYIRVRSSRPLVGLQLFGTSNLSRLSAVPAQVIQ